MVVRKIALEEEVNASSLPKVVSAKIIFFSWFVQAVRSRVYRGGAARSLTQDKPQDDKLVRGLGVVRGVSRERDPRSPEGEDPSSQEYGQQRRHAPVIGQVACQFESDGVVGVRRGGGLRASAETVEKHGFFCSFSTIEKHPQ